MNERHRPNNLSVEELREMLAKSKLRFGLIPAESIREVAKVVTYGSNKYAADLWKDHVRQGISREFLAAALRHINAAMMGEENDPETGIGHYAHAVTDLLFLIWEQVTQPKKENLP